MSKRLAIILALTVTVSFFIPCAVYADGLAPWDSCFQLQSEQVSCVYKLSAHVEGITPQSATSRALYSSAKGKRKRIKQLIDAGYDYYQAVCYCLPGLSALLHKSASQIDCAAVDATVDFNNGHFSYTSERYGYKLDLEATCRTIYNELGKAKIPLQIEVLTPLVTQKQLQANTVLRSSFTTYYAAANTSRSHNIALSLAALNGLIVAPGGTVSFNTAVGARTPERGYKQAKIIVDGQYVEGVGGGVCQASTTLYNALLLGGIQIVERCAHTLPSSYIALGFDAMVSYGGSDLVFTNNTEDNLYFYCNASEGVCRVKIFGMPSHCKVVRKSEKIKSIPMPCRTVTDDSKFADKVKYTTDSFVLREGAEGYVARATLHYYDLTGNFLYSKLLSVDSYKPTERVIVKGALPPPKIAPPVLPNNELHFPILP